MNDFLLDEQGRALQDKAREFVKNEVDAEYLRRMDRDEVRFPRALYESYSKHQLLGLRFSPQYGGQGASWVNECAAMGEIGALLGESQRPRARRHARRRLLRARRAL